MTSLALAPLVQFAEFEPYTNRLRVPPGYAIVFPLPEPSPNFACAYLRAAVRLPTAEAVDVIVVLDGSSTRYHGPPTCWSVGVAQRVHRGEHRIGILRILRAGGLRMTAAKGLSVMATAGVAPPASPGNGQMRDRSTSLTKVRASGSLSRLLGRSLKVGISTDAGGCAHMEDACMVHAPAGSDYAFIGVFDGHGGTGAAHFCRDNLHFNVMASARFQTGDAAAALLDGFRKTEADLILEQSTAGGDGGASGGGGGDRGGGGGGGKGCDGSGAPASAEAGRASGCCGCTALLVLLRSEHLHVGWLGDCRAVLCRNGQAVALTTDHSLSDASERARAIADGAHVEGGRLGGFLEVARALGDFDHTQDRKPAGLSATPELRSEPVGVNDEFVILGSDGLWGVVEPGDAVRFARAELQAYDGDAAMASEKLVEVALRRHADDNIAAAVICLNFPSVEREAPRRPRLMLSKRSVSSAATVSDAAAGGAAAGGGDVGGEGGGGAGSGGSGAGGGAGSGCGGVGGGSAPGGGISGGDISSSTVHAATGTSAAAAEAADASPSPAQSDSGCSTAADTHSLAKAATPWRPRHLRG